MSSTDESRLTFIRYDGHNATNRMGVFACACGKEVRTRTARVFSNFTKSCGCLAAEITSAKFLKHGHTASGGVTRHTRTYQTWTSMRSRCGNPKNRRFATYGARGIAICDRWQDFGNFLADMGEKPPGASIDRIDNDKGYSPENCRWALTREEQARNKTSTVLCEVSATLIRQMSRRGASGPDLAHAFGVTRTMISYVVRGRSWR